MKLHIEFTEIEIKELLYDHIINKFNISELKKEDIKIQVKSKQNYKAEWETAAFRAVVDK